MGVSPYTPPRSERSDVKQATYQQRAWASALAVSGKTPAQVEEFLATAFDFPVTSEAITALPAEKFDIAMRWLTQRADEDMTAALEVSVKAAHAKRNGKGPQPITQVLDRVSGDERAV